MNQDLLIDLIWELNKSMHHLTFERVRYRRIHALFFSQHVNVSSDSCYDYNSTDGYRVSRQEPIIGEIYHEEQITDCSSLGEITAGSN